MRYTRLLFVLLILPVYLFGQNNYVFQHLTAEDGLSSDTKINVFQDKEGFYWFGSVSRLQRFDGKNFISFNYRYKNTQHISESWISEPLEDANNNLWLVNKEGINIFYRNKQQLQRLYMPDAADSNTNDVAVTLKGENNELWILTSKNIFKYDYNSGKPVLYSRLLQDDHAGFITGIYDSIKNGCWLLISTATHAQLAFFNFHTKEFDYQISNIDSLLGHHNPISLFKKDSNNNFWLGNYLGDLCKYNISTQRVTHYDILHQRARQKTNMPNSALYDCLDDGNNEIWFAGDLYTGLLRYDKSTDKFSIVAQENGSEYGLHYDEDIYNLYQDNEGNIWVSTDLGMNIFNVRQQKFKYLEPTQSSVVSKFSADVTCIFQSSTNRIWISTWGDGIFEYNNNFDLIKNYLHDDKNSSSLGEPLNRTWNITEDANGKIWIASQYAMLSVLDTITGKFVNRIVPLFKGKTIMKIVNDKNRNIWFGLYNGSLGNWNEDSNKITVYANSKSSAPMDGLLADEKKDVWLSGDYGLYSFDKNKKLLTKTVLFAQHTLSITALNDSVIMAGTAGSGLCMFNTVSKKVWFYNILNGLSSNIVYGALPGVDNDIWIFASDGIENLNLHTQRVSKYNITDGIKDQVFERAFCQLKNGIIMAAAHSGIIYFNPKDIIARPPPPNVTITAFSVNQHNLSADSLFEYKQIILSHNKNVIAVEYASLSFAGRKTDSYYYQLEGVDKNWVNAGTQRSVTYSNLSPGEYVFKVKAQNADGTSTKKITQLNIIIQPPWWRTWWACILWVCSAVCLIYIVYDYRKRSRNALAEVRQKIASDLHDDIGSTLNSISVYSEVASQQLKTNTQNAQNILLKMGVASRNMIDTMNDIVWSVNPKNDQFEKVLQRMQYFAGELLSGKNILLQFDTDEKIRSIKLLMDKRKNFYLIFKEAINNACKYSEAKNVSIHIAEREGRLVMIIADDGIGFDTQNSYTGNGLKNMQMRTKEIHAQLNITSSLQKGTQIELIMSVK